MGSRKHDVKCILFSWQLQASPPSPGLRRQSFRIVLYDLRLRSVRVKHLLLPTPYLSRVRNVASSGRIRSPKLANGLKGRDAVVAVVSSGILCIQMLLNLKGRRRFTTYLHIFVFC